MYHFAKCCSPIPGDAITGFISRLCGHTPVNLIRVAWEGKVNGQGRNSFKVLYRIAFAAILQNIKGPVYFVCFYFCLKVGSDGSGSQCLGCSTCYEVGSDVLASVVKKSMLRVRGRKGEWPCSGCGSSSPPSDPIASTDTMINRCRSGAGKSKEAHCSG